MTMSFVVPGDPPSGPCPNGRCAHTERRHHFEQYARACNEPGCLCNGFQHWSVIDLGDGAAMAATEAPVEKRVHNIRHHLNVEGAPMMQGPDPSSYDVATARRRRKPVPRPTRIRPGTVTLTYHELADGRWMVETRTYGVPDWGGLLREHIDLVARPDDSLDEWPQWLVRAVQFHHPDNNRPEGDL